MRPPHRTRGFTTIELVIVMSLLGFVNGVALEANRTPTGGNSYSLKIEGAGARNLPRVNPVEVRLGIGNNGGSVSVNAEFER